MALKPNNVNGILSYLTGRSVRSGPRMEDQLLRQRYSAVKNLDWKDLSGHYGCVNAIEFSNGSGEYIASGGDDRRVLLWDVEKALSDIGKPTVMKGEHNSNIFCVAFDIHNKTAFSGGNDEQVIVHDLTTGETKDVFSHDDAVYGLSSDPTNPNMFASACDDGRILIFDVRDSLADPFVLANYTSSMHSVMYNPVEPRLLATANAKEGVGLWDVRNPRSCLLRYGGSLVQQSCMSVRFNHRGDYIVALRRRLPPVLYNISSHQPVCEFDHSGYYNSCTMKSISFAGDNDQYVLSGSDEFNLYMWALPDDLSERSYINSAHMVLKGHRSIVNQVRFNPANHLIISSGVEKIIKVWSPFKLPVKQTADPRSRERRVYTHEEYINLVLQDGSVMSHDYSHESTEEDPRMMAFFDSLVQRELDGWSSDDSMSSNEEALYSRIVQLSQSDIDSDDSFPDLGQNNDDDPAYSPFTIAFASVMASQAAEGNDSFPRLNRALENAERAYAEMNGDQEVDLSADDTPNESQDAENVDSQVNEGSTSQKDLTALIKRKKQELRETMKRRMKNPLVEINESDSDENVDYGESDNSSVSSLNIIIGSSSKVDIKAHAKPLVKNDEEEQTKELSKQAKIKLQRLKNLRKHVMNSDSDASDIEIHEKKLDSETVEASTSILSVNDVGFEKVQFKKFKRRNTSSVEKSKTTDKDMKERASPDLGPFLQKAGTSTSVEVRITSGEEDKNLRTGKFSSDSVSCKGKHKSKSTHKHFREDSSEKCESKYSHTSEHTRSADYSKVKAENHSSHHRYNRHFRDRDKKHDHKDGKAGESHRHANSDKNHRDGKSKISSRFEQEERNHGHNRRDVRTDHSHRHVHDNKKHSDRDSNFHRHIFDGKKDGSKDGRTSESSHRHYHDHRKHHHKDYESGKHLKRHNREDKNHKQTDGKTEKIHRKRVMSDSVMATDLEERRYKFYLEKEDNRQECDDSDGNYRRNIDVKKDSKNYRKNVFGDSHENKRLCKDSDVSKTKNDIDHRESGDKVKVTEGKKKEKVGYVDSCHKNNSDSGRGSDDLNEDLQVSSQYCKECAKLRADGEGEFSCDRDINSDRNGLSYCQCSFNTERSIPSKTTLPKSEKGIEISSRRTESSKEGKDGKKKNNFRKLTTDDQEPTCSYKSKSKETMKVNDDYSGNDGRVETARKDKHENSEDSDDSETSVYCNNDGKETLEEGFNKKDSSGTEEDQLTWLEFKRFKNRLERARKRYTEEKHKKLGGRRWSDDK